MLPAVAFETLRGVLERNPPNHLFHYTSPSGLIGIVSTKSLWATNVLYMNDLKELRQAVETAKLYIDNRLNAPYRATVEASANKIDRSGPEAAFLCEMSSYAGSHGAGIFVASLTEERDLLSQWRAYCPLTGGYSFGLPTSKLLGLANRQGFYLAPCVYDEQTQYRIMGEMVEFHLAKFRSLLKINRKLDSANAQFHDAVLAFSLDVAKYGAILKHRSFSEEKEWRLISTPIMDSSKLKFRDGGGSVVPFCEFFLSDSTWPDIADPSELNNSVVAVVGPTANPGPAQLAVQSLMLKYLGEGCSHGMSEVPFRGK